MTTVNRRSAAPIIYVGETGKVKITYKEDGVAQNIASGYTVVARLISQTGEVLIDDVTQANTGGASWSTGVIECVFPATSTDNLEGQDAFVVATVTTGSVKRVLKQATFVCEAL